jgi:hypothetical protein
MIAKKKVKGALPVDPPLGNQTRLIAPIIAAKNPPK